MNAEVKTICGCRVQQDASGGQGHSWYQIDREDMPATVVLEIEGEIIDGVRESCDDFLASNGQHYRWS